MSKKEVPFNVMMTKEEKSNLQRLAHLEGVSMSQQIRSLAKAAYSMRFNKTPVCATGHACVFPQAHPVIQTPTDEI